jgi:hypothetical protein
VVGVSSSDLANLTTSTFRSLFARITPGST